MDSAILNKEQIEAVRHVDGPLLILAGAGSGKTAAMTYRIAHMLREGVSEYSILAVTFTNKAAAEMRMRVNDIVGSETGVWIMTFHAFCLRVLRAYPEKIGYKTNFTIYDTSDQRTVVKKIMKSNGISEHEFRPQYMLAVISNLKEAEKDPEQYLEESTGTYKDKAIYQVYKEYDNEIRRNNAMDFDDILLNTVRLFEKDNGALEKYRERFRYIMVDEYQDTNHIQYRLIKMLAEKYRNLCVVGDDDQCIYEWRGADISNILDFERDFPETYIIKLEQNYRSKGNILGAANSVIRNNRSRKNKKLWTEADNGEKISYYRADTDRMEAEYIARKIDFMSKKGRGYDEFAILYRTNAQSRLFEETLGQRAIPARVLSGMRYYDRKEVKDIMSYMRLVLNPSDDISFRRVINEPKRGMGQKTVDKLEGLASIRGLSMMEALADPSVIDNFPDRLYKSVKSFVEAIGYCRENKSNMDISEIFDKLLVDSGYLAMLENESTLDAETRLDNIMEFKTVIHDYEAIVENPTLEEFMERLTLAAEVDSYEAGEKTVTLMTIHSAKGLEFPVVFIPGLEDGLFPGNKAFDDDDKMEEERRLCYVAMTRAKELLFLTSALVRTRYGHTEYTRESQFLREMEKKFMSGDAVYTKRSGDTSLGVNTGSRDGFAEEPFKPFDALNYARMETKKVATAGNVNFRNGDRVCHDKFGEGEVIDVQGRVITIDFGGDIKKLAAGIAKLNRL